jgi:hypothetical protein
MTTSARGVDVFVQDTSGRNNNTINKYTRRDMTVSYSIHR